VLSIRSAKGSPPAGSRAQRARMDPLSPIGKTATERAGIWHRFGHWASSLGLLACLCALMLAAFGRGAVTSFRAAPIGVGTPADESAWQAELAAFDAAIAIRDIARARTGLRVLRASADQSGFWKALVDLADAQLRLGRVAGVPGLSRDGARQNYALALRRAREQRSQEGVRVAKDALAALDGPSSAGD